MQESFTRLPALVDALADALRPFFDLPFAFFGHSMGALVGFELARELRRRRAPVPVHLFLSGHRGPRLPRRRPPLHHLPPPEFIRELRALNGFPEEILQNEELLDLFVPILRADLELCETYVYTPEHPLQIPCTILGGDADPEVAIEELHGWSAESASSCTVRVFSGDHFYLSTSRELVLRNLRETLSAGPG